jgi:hypothetical protein
VVTEGEPYNTNVVLVQESPTQVDLASRVKDHEKRFARVGIGLGSGCFNPNGNRQAVAATWRSRAAGVLLRIPGGSLLCRQ